MKRLLLTLYCSAFAAAAHASEADALFSKVSPSIVSIFTQVGNKSTGSFGSGVTVGTGLVVTNCHVVARNAGIWIHHDGKYYRGESAASDPRRDLCLVRAPGLAAPVIVVGSSLALKEGQEVWSLGAPKTLEKTIGSGIVAGLRAMDGGHIIKTTAPAYAGASGGGLFNAQGQLVGVLTATSKSGANLQFALPAEWIRKIGEPQGKEGFRPPVSILEEATNIEAGHISKSGVITAADQNDEFFNSNPKKEAEKNEQARKIMANGNWERLRGYAEQWIEADPQSVDAWMYLGHANSALKDTKETIAAFTEAVKLDPENALAHYYLGNTYVFLGKNSDAVAAYQEAVRLSPRDKTFRNALEWAQEAIERHTAAARPRVTAASQQRAEPTDPVMEEADLGYKPTPDRPGVGKAILILGFLYALSAFAIYVTYLVNVAKPWGTPYPEENRKGAAILAGAGAFVLFVPTYIFFF